MIRIFLPIYLILPSKKPKWEVLNRIWREEIESECEFKGHNLSNLNRAPMSSNLINQNGFQEIKPVSWLNYPGLGDTRYNEKGDYDSNGNLQIVDKGPEGFDLLLASFL